MASNNTSTVPDAAICLTEEGRRAYVTLLAGNGDDVEGVKGLAKGLSEVNSKYSLVVAILPDVPEDHRQMLEGLGCLVKEIPPVYSRQLASMFPYVTKYSKLHLWGYFEEYNKMIYLDGDTQVYANIDLLFDSPDSQIHAPLDSLSTGTWSHPVYKQFPVSFKWPTELGPKPTSYYSASMFVFEPRKSISVKLLQTLRKITRLRPIPFAEQHVLNSYFRTKLAPFAKNVYRALTMLNEKKNNDLKEVKVIHYSSPELRPWRPPPKMGNVEFVNKRKRRWSDISDDGSLDAGKQNLVETENSPNFPSASGTKCEGKLTKFVTHNGVFLFK